MKQLILAILLLVSTGFSAQPQPIIFNFENTAPVTIIPTLSNVWQIGKPQKTYFSSAWNGTKAILTDSINYYPANNQSDFVIRVPAYNTSYGVHMEFRHKFQTDSLKDGGTILVSGNGATWTNVINSPAYHGLSFGMFGAADSVKSLSQPGFSGKSNGWKTSHVYWNYPPLDTLWIKFRFGSDNQHTNKDGWMIDSLVISYDLGIGIKESVRTAKFTFAPNPFSSIAILRADQPIPDPQLTVFRADGRQENVLSEANNSEIIIRRGDLSVGVYYYILRSEGKIMARGKLIVL
jgi:hypothetical protein